MRTFVCIVLACLGLGACAEDTSDEPGVDRDTLTRRQKDSITAESGLPGAGAVGRALDASDAAAEHNAEMDSVMRR